MPKLQKICVFLIALLFAVQLPTAVYADTQGYSDSNAFPIVLGEAQVHSINSVGGVDVDIYYRNTSGKDIKYITFSVTPYNAVGDVVNCRISRQASVKLEKTGPVTPFQYAEDFAYYKFNGEWTHVWNGQADVAPYIHRWNDDTRQYEDVTIDYRSGITGWAGWSTVWYNNTISSLAVTNVSIIYMDGTSINLNREQLQQLTIRRITVPSIGEQTGVYIGGYTNNMPNGYGEFEYRHDDGSVQLYRGQWKDGQFVG